MDQSPFPAAAVSVRAPRKARPFRRRADRGFLASGRLSRQPAAPVSRSSLVMSYRDDLDAGRDLSIDDVVRKSSKNIAPRTRLEARPDPGGAPDQGKSTLRLSKERFRSLETSLKVPLEGVVDLPESFRSEVNLGGAHSASTGTGCESPPRELFPRFRPPRRPYEQQPPASTPSRRRLPVQAASSSTVLLRFPPGLAPAALELSVVRFLRVLSCLEFYHPGRAKGRGRRPLRRLLRPPNYRGSRSRPRPPTGAPRGTGVR